MLQLIKNSVPLFIIVMSLELSAQHVYFFDEHGNYAKEAEAVCYQHRSNSLVNNQFIDVKTYDAVTHKLMFTGSMLKFSAITDYSLGPDVYDGTYVTYYPSGNVKAKGSYRLNKQYGDYYMYNEEEELIKHLNYPHPDSTAYFDQYSVWEFTDQNSDSKVRNGEGEYVVYHENGTIREKGRIREANKDGEWKYFNNDGVLIATEHYANGQFDYGTSYSSSGMEMDYTTIFLPSGPIGGMPRFMENCQKLAAGNYPKNAKQLGISGPVMGILYVNEEGKVTFGGIIRGIGGGCDEIFANILNQIEIFRPAYLRGQAISSRHFIAVKFELD